MSNVSTLNAARLAVAYHRVMNMVSNKSAVELPGLISPRRCLESYFQISKVCDIKLHNEIWEELAEEVVLELTEKRRLVQVMVLRDKVQKIAD